MNMKARLRDNPVGVFVGWDVRNWSRALDFWLTRTHQNVSKSLALELGSETGGLSLWLALQGTRVLCSDITPLRSSVHELHAARRVDHLIRYETISAMDIPYTCEFDIVVFKSILGYIGCYGGKDAQAK